jgi:predicted acylesterase/phospholipase RssA
MAQDESPLLANPNKPIVIALGSGSVLSLAASIALLRVVEELGSAGRIRQIWGCSAGSIAGSLYALGTPVDEIYEQIARLHRHDLVDYNWSGFLSAIFTGRIKGGLLHGKKMIGLCHKWLGEKQFTDTKIKLRILAYRLEPEPERLTIFSSGEIFPALAASFAMPGLLPPYSIGDELFCDPSAQQKVPILAAAEEARLWESKPLIIANYCGWAGENRERNPRELFSNLFHAKEILQWELTQTSAAKARALGSDIILLTTPVYNVGNLALGLFRQLEEQCRQAFTQQLGFAGMPTTPDK